VVRAGSLVVVGTGIKAVVRVTREAQHRLETADKLLYVLADPLTIRWVEELNSTAESLSGLYEIGKARSETYRAMTEQVLFWVRRGLTVCLALYGHAGVFAAPGHDAIRQARAEGFHAEMLPGVSSEDCLFADLGLDPGSTGCQSYEATDFLLRPKCFDVSVPLILLQVGLVGELGYSPGSDCQHLQLLVDHLRRFYDDEHQVRIYEAAQFPICPPRITVVSLERLGQAEVRPISTLYIPPARTTAPSREMYERLGICPPPGQPEP
jgi:uncharacterized protein YabN with tetrapyrrole methylase and pyrophosphatase domain